MSQNGDSIGPFLVFVSHPWKDSGHPDPDGSDLRSIVRECHSLALVAAAQRLLNGNGAVVNLFNLFWRFPELGTCPCSTDLGMLVPDDFRARCMRALIRDESVPFELKVAIIESLCDRFGGVSELLAVHGRTDVVKLFSQSRYKVKPTLDSLKYAKIEASPFDNSSVDKCKAELEVLGKSLFAQMYVWFDWISIPQGGETEEQETRQVILQNIPTIQSISWTVLLDKMDEWHARTSPRNVKDMDERGWCILEYLNAPVTLWRRRGIHTGDFRNEGRAMCMRASIVGRVMQIKDLRPKESMALCRLSCTNDPDFEPVWEMIRDAMDSRPELLGPSCHNAGHHFPWRFSTLPQCRNLSVQVERMPCLPDLYRDLELPRVRDGAYNDENFIDTSSIPSHVKLVLDEEVLNFQCSSPLTKPSLACFDVIWLLLEKGKKVALQFPGESHFLVLYSQNPENGSSREASRKRARDLFLQGTQEYRNEGNQHLFDALSS